MQALLINGLAEACLGECNCRIAVVEHPRLVQGGGDEVVRQRVNGNRRHLFSIASHVQPQKPEAVCHRVHSGLSDPH